MVISHDYVLAIIGQMIILKWPRKCPSYSAKVIILSCIACVTMITIATAN